MARLRCSEDGGKHMTTAFNLLDPNTWVDKYAAYRQLREAGPVMIPIGGKPMAFITRYHDVEPLLKSAACTVKPSPTEFPPHIGSGAGSIFYKLSLPHLDSPVHMQLRRIVTASFTPKGVGQMEEWVAKIVDSHLDELVPGKPIDVANGVAASVPMAIARRLFHLPAEATPILVDRVPEVTAIVGHSALSPEDLRKVDESMQFLFDFFSDHLQRHSKLPEDDFLGGLIQAERAGTLTRDEVLATLVGFFVANVHATKTALTNALYLLAHNEAQYRDLVANPELAASAWEESLRFDSPTHFVHRYNSEPLNVGGLHIAPRTRLLLGLASANRDPLQFESADRFDIRRQSTRHLAFALGAHFCAGAPLARVEGRMMLSGLARRFPSIQLTDQPPLRNPDMSFPFIESLTLELRRAA
jgi:cytochrome P450